MPRHDTHTNAQRLKCQDDDQNSSRQPPVLREYLRPGADIFFIIRQTTFMTLGDWDGRILSTQR